MAKEMNFINDYLQYAEKQTDAPPLYHELCAISAISAVVGHNVYLQYGSQRLYPNLYILLLGPSSSFRKTTCMNMSKHLVRKVNDTRILPNEFSQEALLDTLANKPQGIFYYSEFQTLAGLLSRDYMAGAKAFITDLYDSPSSYQRETRSTHVLIKDPCVSMLTASTQEWFLKGLKEEDFGTGFLARFTILSETEKEKSIAWPTIPDILVENQLVATLKHISELKSEMSVCQRIPDCAVGGKEAIVRDVYEGWYYDIWETQVLSRHHSIFLPFFERLSVVCIKFAMIQALSKGRTEIQQEDFGNATKLTEIIADRLIQLEGEEMVFNRDQALRKKIKKIIERNKNILRCDLLRDAHCSAKDLDNAIQTLTQTKEVCIGKTLTGKDRKTFSNCYYIPDNERAL